MEVFTVCDCDNIIKSYVAHYKQKQIAVTIRVKTHSVNEPSKLNTDGNASVMPERKVTSSNYLEHTLLLHCIKWRILSRTVSAVWHGT